MQLCNKSGRECKVGAVSLEIAGPPPSSLSKKSGDYSPLAIGKI